MKSTSSSAIVSCRCQCCSQNANLTDRGLAANRGKGRGWMWDSVSIRIYLFHHIPLFFFLQGLDKIEFLQSHENQEIYQKAFDLIEHYFGVEDDSTLPPQVDENQQQFIFQQPEAPMEGFQL